MKTTSVKCRTAKTGRVPLRGNRYFRSAPSPQAMHFCGKGVRVNKIPSKKIGGMSVKRKACDVNSMFIAENVSFSPTVINMPNWRKLFADYIDTHYKPPMPYANPNLVINDISVLAEEISPLRGFFNKFISKIKISARPIHTMLKSGKKRLEADSGIV